MPERWRVCVAGAVRMRPRVRRHAVRARRGRVPRRARAARAPRLPAARALRQHARQLLLRVRARLHQGCGARYMPRYYC